MRTAFKWENSLEEMAQVLNNLHHDLFVFKLRIDTVEQCTKHMWGLTGLNLHTKHSTQFKVEHLLLGTKGMIAKGICTV
jgi:hypothetical protein